MKILGKKNARPKLSFALGSKWRDSFQHRHYVLVRKIPDIFFCFLSCSSCNQNRSLSSFLPKYLSMKRSGDQDAREPIVAPTCGL
jgi:hypothetical protein